MEYCINCDHPDICHDLSLKICYRIDSYRKCSCIQYTEAPPSLPGQDLGNSKANLAVGGPAEFVRAMNELANKLGQASMTE